MTDPRNVTPFSLPMIPEDENLDSSTFSFLALGLGVYGLLFKNKYYAVLGLFCNIIALCNQRSGSPDQVRSTISSICFSVLGLVVLYVQLLTTPVDSSIFDIKSLL